MYFPTTQWSLLAHASLNGETAARNGLEELCRRYWLPLQQFIRSRGYSEVEAQDLTQEFLLHLLEHSTLEKADRLKGRFRSFLLGALVRFLSDEYDRRNAQKRGYHVPHLSVEEHEGELPASSQADAISFDREWALVILENALRSLHAELEASGRTEQFAVLRRFLPGSLEAPTYEVAAEQLGLSLGAFKSELHRLRLQLRALVREEVATTVAVPHEVDDEMEYLQRVLMDKGNDFRASTKPSPPIS